MAWLAYRHGVGAKGESERLRNSTQPLSPDWQPASDFDGRRDFSLVTPVSVLRTA